MRIAGIQEIKTELGTCKPSELAYICLRLARFKKENKELITYLLFEAHNEEAYASAVKQEVDELFSSINISNLYWVKKSLRKIIRVINKYCRYSGSKTTEVELRLHFCQCLNQSGIPFHQNAAISNLYASQIKKINTLIISLHEDLQYDYMRELKKLL